MHPHSKKFLIVKGAGGGGLGDRIRCVISGLAYSKLTDRTLFVDWSDGKLIPDYRNVFNDLFALSQIDHVTQCPVTDDVWPKAWQGRLNESLHTLYTEYDPHGWNRQAACDMFSFDQTKLNYAHKALILWNFDQFDQIAQQYRQDSFQLAQELTRTHLRPCANIQTAINDFRHENFPESEKVIGVHIRATNEFDLIKSSVDLDQYFKVIDKILNHTAATLFLATDNVDVQRILDERYPGRIITRNKWFAKAGERLHFNDDCPQPEKALIDAMTEMLLLSKCDYLI